MGPALYIIAILGCGEGEAACQQVGVAQAQYQSEAECLAATEGQLMRHSDLAYPLVVAQCRRLGAEPARLMPEDVLRAAPERAPLQPSRARQQLAGRY